MKETRFLYSIKIMTKTAMTHNERPITLPRLRWLILISESGVGPKKLVGSQNSLEPTSAEFAWTPEPNGTQTFEIRASEHKRPLIWIVLKFFKSFISKNYLHFILNYVPKVSIESRIKNNTLRVRYWTTFCGWNTEQLRV